MSRCFSGIVRIFAKRLVRGDISPLFRFIMTEKEDIKKLIEAYLQGSDCFLVEVKLSPGKLAVAVDKPSGITLDECTALPRHLLDHFEETGFLDQHEVEVGSPGMDSPLMVPQQYHRRIGKELRLRLVDGREMKGVLEAVEESGIVLKEALTKKENKKKIVTEELHNISFADIKEAKLIINFKFK